MYVRISTVCTSRAIESSRFDAHRIKRENGEPRKEPSQQSNPLAVNLPIHFQLPFIHSSTMKFTTIIPVMLATLLPLASAIDFRILVEFDSSEYPSGDDFCTTWLSTWCALFCFQLISSTDADATLPFIISRSYQPSDTSLFYIGSLCRPGDYSGNNLNSEALVTCVFEKSVADGVVAQLGITHV